MPPPFYPRAAGRTLGELFGQEQQVTGNLADMILANRSANMREAAFADQLNQQMADRLFQNRQIEGQNQNQLLNFASRIANVGQDREAAKLHADALGAAKYAQNRELAFKLLKEDGVSPDELKDTFGLTPADMKLAKNIYARFAKDEDVVLKGAEQQAKTIQDTIIKAVADMAAAKRQQETFAGLEGLLKDPSRVRPEPGIIGKFFRSLGSGTSPFVNSMDPGAVFRRDVNEPVPPLELSAKRIATLKEEAKKRGGEATAELTELQKKYGTDPIAAYIEALNKNAVLSQQISIDPTTGKVTLLPRPRVYSDGGNAGKTTGATNSFHRFVPGQGVLQIR